MDDTWPWLTYSYGHAESLQGQFGIESGGGSIANHLLGAGVQHRCQLDKASPNTDVGDISQPHLVQPVDKHPLDEIGVSWEVVAAICSLHPLPFNATEPDNTPKYVRNCVKIWERTTGPVAVGTTFREISAGPGGMKSKCINRVTEYNRPYRLVIETTNGIHLVIVFKLGSKNGGTLFTMSVDWTMGGKFLTILLDKLFMGKWIVRNFEDSLDSLKKQVESG